MLEEIFLQIQSSVEGEVETDCWFEINSGQRLNIEMSRFTDQGSNLMQD